MSLGWLMMVRTFVGSQFFRYLAVGVWNTVFGIGLYWLAYLLFRESVHYLLLAVPVNILAITNAFICYKLIVFRTKENWGKEYVKCYLVYGGGALVSMALLWLFVDCFQLNPVFANIVGTGLVVIGSYFGHKYFSFRNRGILPGR